VSALRRDKRAHAVASRALGSLARLTPAMLIALPACNDVLGITSLSVVPSADDAAAGGDAGPDWCRANAPDATACEDFDGPGEFARGGWSPQGGNRGEIGALDDVVFRSPSRALTMSTPALGNGSPAAQWCIAHPFPSSLHIALALDVRIDTLDTNGAYMTFADLALGGAPPSSGTHLSLAIDRAGLHLLVLQGASPLPVDHLFSTSLALGTWVRVAIDVVRDVDGGTGAQASVSLDGRELAFVEGPSAGRFVINGAGDTTVDVGACYVSAPSVAQVVHVDDVVVDLR
jgi:hypothetical protein